VMAVNGVLLALISGGILIFKRGGVLTRV
jgi:hypothetical protein